MVALDFVISVQNPSVPVYCASRWPGRSVPAAPSLLHQIVVVEIKCRHLPAVNFCANFSSVYQRPNKQKHVEMQLGYKPSTSTAGYYRLVPLSELILVCRRHMQL